MMSSFFRIFALRELPSAVFALTLAASTVLGAASLKGAESEPEKRPDTLVLGDRLEMVSSETENRFYFYDNVEVKGNNLHATGDKMVVVSMRGKQADAELGAIESITMEGNVVIRQGDREATAGKAVIFPKKGEVVLTENPMLRNPDGVVRGSRIIFRRGEKQAVVEGGAARASISLQGFDDFDPAGQLGGPPKTPEPDADSESSDAAKNTP